MSETAQTNSNYSEAVHEAIQGANSGVVVIGPTGAGVATAALLLYDADASQTFIFEISDDDGKYETGHVFQALSDERYLQYLKSFDVKGSEIETESKVKEASAELWNDLIIEVENIEFEEGENWKDLIDIDEKNDALNMLLAVAIAEPDAVNAGKRKLSAQSSQTIHTEAYFNGKPIKQKHVLQAKNLEFVKKFDRVKAKQFEQEKTKGLSRKPVIKFVPQDEAFAKLYDEMLISSEGFKENKIPVRFKSKVIEYAFASKIDEKK